MEKADTDINGLTNCAKRVSTTNTAGWKCLNPMCSSLRTFGPDFKLAFLMYFWGTMIGNNENIECNKIETFMDLVAQKKTDVTKQHYYKISWITADDYAVHQSKEFHEKLPGATTGEELDINDGHDERQRKIYFQPIPTKNTGTIERQDQTVVFKSTEKVGSIYESDNKTMTSDLDVTFRLGQRMNSTQTHAGASAATLSENGRIMKNGSQRTAGRILGLKSKNFILSFLFQIILHS